MVYKSRNSNNSNNVNYFSTVLMTSQAVNHKSMPLLINLDISGAYNNCTPTLNYVCG